MAPTSGNSETGKKKPITFFEAMQVSSSDESDISDSEQDDMLAIHDNSDDENIKSEDTRSGDPESDDIGFDDIGSDDIGSDDWNSSTDNEVEFPVTAKGRNGQIREQLLKSPVAIFNTHALRELMVHLEDEEIRALKNMDIKKEDWMTIDVAIQLARMSAEQRQTDVKNFEDARFDNLQMAKKRARAQMTARKHKSNDLPTTNTLDKVVSYAKLARHFGYSNEEIQRRPLSDFEPKMVSNAIPNLEERQWEWYQQGAFIWLKYAKYEDDKLRFMKAIKDMAITESTSRIMDYKWGRRPTKWIHVTMVKIIFGETTFLQSKCAVLAQKQFPKADLAQWRRNEDGPTTDPRFMDTITINYLPMDIQVHVAAVAIKNSLKVTPMEWDPNAKASSIRGGRESSQNEEPHESSPDIKRAEASGDFGQRETSQDATMKALMAQARTIKRLRREVRQARNAFASLSSRVTTLEQQSEMSEQRDIKAETIEYKIQTKGNFQAVDEKFKVVSNAFQKLKNQHKKRKRAE
ncbi:hypothetical protein BGZ63DRAFT_400695 [Mariannaea sp. PMI_226]|nr:hypothetical protein BGZ63DRAFT_400695 [Mariannaea sp. PMI_226]